MKTLYNNHYTAHIFYDGSMRIEPDGKHLCLGLSDLKVLLKEAQEYSNLICNGKEIESGGADSGLGQHDFRLRWPEMSGLNKKTK